LTYIATARVDPSKIFIIERVRDMSFVDFTYLLIIGTVIVEMMVCAMAISTIGTTTNHGDYSFPVISRSLKRIKKIT